ncbi:MAG: ABC transporter permease [Thermoprotei archaeon]
MTQDISQLEAVQPASKNEFRLTLDLLFKDKVAMVGAGIIVVFIVLSALAKVDLRLLTKYSPNALNFAQANKPPSLSHLFGTDADGRDVFTRVLAALPLDITIPFIVVGSGVLIGYGLGLIAGYLGGRIEELILRLTDLFFAFPAIVLALAIAGILGQTDLTARLYFSEIALIIVSWPFYTRLARAQVMYVKSGLFVKAAVASGLSSFKIVRKHIIPHVTPIIVAYATLDLGTVILVYSVFAFFGLGATPPTPELGRMVYDGLNSLPGNWWWSFFPGLILTLLALGFSLLGEGLRDALDPRRRSQFPGYGR